MPAFNAIPYLPRSVQSIQGQTLSDIELIIVNDGSTDDTGRIAEELAGQDARIRVIHNDTNLGEASAFNTGVRAASSTIIARMDADDIAMPSRLEKQLTELQANPQVAVLGTYASHTNDREEILSLSETGPATDDEFHEMRARGEPAMVFGGTAMFRSEQFEEIGGYDTELSTAADFDFCDRMGDYGIVRALPEPLLLYRVHNNSNVMRRFFDGRLNHRYVRARRRAAANGDPYLTRAEYLQWERKQSLWWRLRTRQGDLGQFHYRAAGISYANRRRAKMSFHLVVAVVADPGHVIKRLWNQRLAPAARRARLQTSFAEDSLRD